MMDYLNNLFKIENKKNIGLKGLTDESFCVYVYDYFSKNDKSIVIVTPTLFEANKLLNSLDCNVDECISIKYRGDGWPGYTTVKDCNGNVFKMTYNDSWGQILGRDIMPMCRYCIDGVGELADISCGDAWYLAKDGYPDFSEHNGRNVVFCRNDLGAKLFDEIVNENRIYREQVENLTDYLGKIQYAQRERRETMLAKILASKILFRRTPKYSFKLLWNYFSGSNFETSFRVFKGSIKRILIGKM